MDTSAEALAVENTERTAEDEARALLGRMGVKWPGSFSSGDLVELANLIAERCEPASERVSVPVAAWSHGGTPTVVCDDGTVWAYEPEGFSRMAWRRKAPIPGTLADVRP